MRRAALAAAVVVAALVAVPAALAAYHVSLRPSSAGAGQIVSAKLVGCNCFARDRLFLAPASVVSAYGEGNPVFTLDKRFSALGTVASPAGFSFKVPRVKAGSYRLYVECLGRDGCVGVRQFLPLQGALAVR